MSLLHLGAFAYPLARKLLFRMDAEKAHHRTMSTLAFVQGFVESIPIEHDPVQIMGLNFLNRVGLAAGLDKSAECIDGFGALGFGHVEVGTVTPRAQPGNPEPRLFRLKKAQAVINRMGFNNPGVEAVMANVKRRRYRGILGANIGKNFDTPNERALDDYLFCLREVYPQVDYVTVNLSSPNTKGLRDLQMVETLSPFLDSLMEERERLADKHLNVRPIAVKIAPDLENSHVDAIGQLIAEMGADAIIATNTTVSRAGVEGLPQADETGGLSGAPLRERSTEVIARLHKAVGKVLPIIGVGGILSANDAKEKLEAGASLVQIYTGLIYRGPALVKELLAMPSAPPRFPAVASAKARTPGQSLGTID